MNCDKCQSCTHTYNFKNELGLPNVNTLFLGVTDACNSRCTYCFVTQKPNYMSCEMAFSGVDWLYKNAQKKNLLNNPKETFTINFFGGEPLLRWDDIIVPVTHYAKRLFGKQIRFGITSNCIALTEDKLKFMTSNDFSLLFSFDGCKSCQDINRPLPNKEESSFDYISQKIPMILKYYPQMTMRMTIDADTVEYVYENHKFAIESGFTSMFAAINTYGNWTEEKYKILKEQMYKVADLYVEYKKQGKEIRIDPLLRMQDKINKINKNDGIHRLYNKDVGAGKCGIGLKTTTLSFDGNFYTCQEVYTNKECRDNFLVGHISSGLNDYERLRVAKSVNPLEARSSDGYNCKECPLDKVCDGECSIRNYTQNGDVNIVPAPQCNYNRMLYEIRQYITNQLNPPLKFS